MIAGRASWPRWRRSGALIVLLLLGARCGASVEERPAAGGERPAAAPAPVDPGGSPDAAPAAAAESPRPPDGSVVVGSSAQGVSVAAQRAPLRSVLGELARECAFELQLAEGAASTLVTLRTADSRIEDVLADVLRGIPYSLDFGPGDGRRTPALLRVRVGARAVPAPEHVARRSQPRRPRDGSDGSRGLPAEEVERRAAQRRELREEMLVKLEDPDPDIRAEAAAWIEPDLEGLALAERLLAEDPSAEVRAAAAGSLAGGDPVGAASVLLGALDDPDPRVVIAALDALEFAGDASIVPALAPLLQHRDPEVRARTVEAIEFLE
jgi:hypothetical protein